MNKDIKQLAAKEATNRIKGLIKYDDCSMPITEADRLRKHGVAEYNKAISDVLNVLATTTPLSSSSGDAPLNSNNSIGLITALLSGKQLVKIHEIGEKETFWCEKGKNGRNYFYVQGWGSALGRAEDRVFDVIDNPEKWRIELQNAQVSDTTKGDSSKEA
jgi:hypothetical protein